MNETFFEILRQGIAALKEAGITEYETDAGILFEEAFAMDRGRYFLVSGDVCRDEEGLEKYRKWIRLRSGRIPVQQLTHRQEFMGLDFYVNENVLIPRQDTEILADYARKAIGADKCARVLDMCTGSGCLLLSLCAHLPGVSGVGADISEPALEVAKINRERLGIAPERAKFVKSDFLTEVELETFDLIVSNPPYIPGDVIETLDPEVKDHEPHLALEAGENGLYFYRRLAEESMDFLKPGGRILMEIGYDQAEDVRHIFEGVERDGGGCWTDIRTIRDLAGLDRVIMAVLEEQNV